MGHVAKRGRHAPILALLLCGAASLGAPLAAPLTAQRATRSELVQTLDAWIREYRAGRIDMRSWNERGLTSGVRHVTGGTGSATPLRELQLLVDAAARDGSVEAARRVLRLAGSGLDRARYSHAHACAMVRTIAERALIGMRTAPVKRMILAAAQAGNDDDAERAAALRAAGNVDSEKTLATLRSALAESQPWVRLAAVDGLRRAALPASVADLTKALRSETEASVQIALAQALLDVFDRCGAAIPTRPMRDATRAVIEVLGRCGWRAGLALLPFLERLRTTEAVPTLIDILARCNDRTIRDPEAASGTLRARTHELLVDLTGALFPANRPGEWRAFWEKERGTFRVASTKAGATAHTVSQGFFGIEIKGTRVVFILDVSLSMREPYPWFGTAAAGQAVGKSKAAVAKRQLRSAIESLPAEAQFNIVAFAGKTGRWHRNLVPATVSNKKNAARWVQKLELQPATDVWGALDRALKISSVAHGERYETHVDEIFLLTDGWPTAGEIRNPRQILETIDDTNRFSMVRINTVFLGTDEDVMLHGATGFGPTMDWMKPPEMMERLAAHNGGRYVRPEATALGGR